jgi:hypothetical protein
MLLSSSSLSFAYLLPLGHPLVQLLMPTSTATTPPTTTSTATFSLSSSAFPVPPHVPLVVLDLCLLIVCQVLIPNWTYYFFQLFESYLYFLRTGQQVCFMQTDARLMLLASVVIDYHHHHPTQWCCSNSRVFT